MFSHASTHTHTRTHARTHALGHVVATYYTTILLNSGRFTFRSWQAAAMLVKGRRLIDIPSAVVFTPAHFHAAL